MVNETEMSRAYKTYTQRPISTVCLLGFGALGCPVGVELALWDVSVQVYDVTEYDTKSLRKKVQNACKDLLTTGQLLQTDVDKAMMHIQTTTNPANAMQNAQLVIEMLPDKYKVSTLQTVQKFAGDDVIFASSLKMPTTNLHLDTIADSLSSKKDSLLGMRFLMPCILIDHVEVTRTSYTSDTTWDRALGFLRSLNKYPFYGHSNITLNDDNIRHLQQEAVARRKSLRDGSSEFIPAPPFHKVDNDTLTKSKLNYTDHELREIEIGNLVDTAFPWANRDELRMAQERQEADVQARAEAEEQARLRKVRESEAQAQARLRDARERHAQAQAKLRKAMERDLSHDNTSQAIGLNPRMRRYAALASRKATAMAILQDTRAAVQADGSMSARKYILRKVIPDCHPDRHRDNIGHHAVAEVVTKVANKIVSYFTEEDLWQRPDEWEKHIDYLVGQSEI